jgi:hypothetical protein
VSIIRRLVPSRWGRSPKSAYVYMPPKYPWWPAVAAFAAGGLCVFVLVRSLAAPSAADTGYRTAPVAALAPTPQFPSTPQAFAVLPPESASADAATAVAEPAEPASAPAAAEANVRRTAAKSSTHRHVAKKSHRNDPGNFDRFSGGYRGSTRQYSGYGNVGYGFNAN